ncbi:protein kinase domain-containing protein [Calidifontibacter indicus]|uniref:non-specific serine/threonine protein kinase n=1 Tax=Calidifontibacter indicus TaxID=419650 RepID=A0A3D9UI87_9MICO|nr:protein kinase [Calidifontibacter indicus]REF29178.1 serine/threonine protein kinase [Calidifontibacter indicus]
MSAAAAGRVGNRYELRARIAGGGMGEVWRAHDEVLDRPVAVKMLHAGLAGDPGFLERFRVEARNAAKLSHGNIAQVHDYGEDAGSAYLVMELVEGEPLSALIKQRAPFSPADAVALLVQAAAALEAAHRKGIIHRDVKPANVVVDADGVAKLTDFGIARALGSAGMTRAGEVLGTPQYLPPEAALGHEIGPFSDVYSLAVVAFEMLSGHWPFTADTAVGLAMAHVSQPPPPLPAGVPTSIADVVHRGLAKEPADRYPGAAQFADALSEALEQVPPALVDEDISEVSTTVFRRPEVQPETGAEPSAEADAEHGAEPAGEAASGLEPSTELDAEHDADPEVLAARTTTVHPEAQHGRALLAPGQNSTVPGRFVEVTVSVAAGVGEQLDPVAFELDAHGQALGDSSFVFFNNPVSGSGAVSLSQNGIRIDLDQLPDECEAVVVALADDHPIGEQQLEARVAIGEVELALDTRVLSAERAVILARIYRRDGMWKLRNVMAGWADGLEPLVRAFGIDVAD